VIEICNSGPAVVQRLYDLRSDKLNLAAQKTKYQELLPAFQRLVTTSGYTHQGTELDLALLTREGSLFGHIGYMILDSNRGEICSLIVTDQTTHLMILFNQANLHWMLVGYDQPGSSPGIQRLFPINPLPAIVTTLWNLQCSSNRPLPLPTTFDTRLKLSKTCVIGAGYGNGNGVQDAERWGKVDPNYIGINGHPDLMGTIPGNPIGEFNWNAGIEWVKDIFVTKFRENSFEVLYIDRATLRAKMDIGTVDNLFRLLGKWSSQGVLTIDKVMIPKRDVTFITKVPEKALLKSRAVIDAWTHTIKKHAGYSESINKWLERVNEEGILVAGVEFVEYRFKKIQSVQPSPYL
jgi:hypothetical protein